MGIKTSVRPYAGATAIFVQDTPITGIMHWNRKMTAEDARHFADSGVQCFSFIGNINLEDGSQTYEGNAFQTMTEDFLDQNMETILSGCPQALVLPRFRLYASQEWMRKHPQAPIRFYDLNNGKTGIAPMPSLAYEPWIQDALAALRKAVIYTEKKWNDHILGYHSGFGQCGEHVTFWEPKICDYNPAMTAFFRTWLTTRYHTDENLRKAWNKTDMSLESALPPPPEDMAFFNPQTSPALWNPATQQQIIDFMACQAELMATRITQEAKTVKDALRELHSQKIFGAFYGYVNLPFNSLTHYAVPHQAQQIVLDCPDVDFIAAPLDYEARQPGGVTLPQLIPGSIVAHGKLYYAEDDTGTHLSTFDYNLQPDTVEQARQAMVRNFFETWRAGGTQWYMDLMGIGTYRDSRLMETIAKLSDFAAKHAEHRESIAQIAVFSSDEALNVSKTFDVLSGALLELQLHELAAIGAPFDFYRLEDLPLLAKQKKLKNIKLAVMLNAHVIKPEVVDAINQDLKKDHRTILWMHSPNVCQNDGFSAKAASEIMEINCVLAQHRHPMETETFLDGTRTVFGIPQAGNPKLYAADEEAQELGFAVQGTYVPFRKNTRGATFARKQRNNWTSVWCAGPVMPDKILRIIATDAGVHLFSKRGDQVAATEEWIAIHAKWTAPLTIRLKSPKTATDAFTGKIVANKTTEINLNTVRGQNVVLLLE